MRKKDVKRIEKCPSPAQNTRHKPSLLIRPRGFSLELDNVLFVRRLSPARTPTLKSTSRMTLNILGALLVVGAIWFFLSEALINAHPGIDMTAATKSLRCVNINLCAVPGFSKATSTTTVASQIPQTPSPAVQATAEHTAVPTKTPPPKPSPDPTLPPTVTPATAYLKAAPVPLTISLTSTCVKGQSAILTLTNGGGSSLIWFQDTANSSRGIKISDPTKTHLLQSGKSVNATVTCLATLVVGLYKLIIDYNGGAVNVAVKITL